MKTSTDYDVVRNAAMELEALAISARASADAYRQAVRSVAREAGLEAGVLRSWIKARISGAVEKNAYQAEQLSLLFEEFE